MLNQNTAKNSSSALGRGLGALIPNGAVAKQPVVAPMHSSADQLGEHIRKVSVDEIVANPWQPRTAFDAEALKDLGESIRRYGILQPLVVSPVDNGYQLIAGERRFQAAKLVGLTEVPVIIRKAEDQEKLELALVENIQRQNLNPLDEATSYRRLMDEFSLTQEEVAKKVGKSRSSIANTLRLLQLPEVIQKAIREEKISFSHAKVLLSITDPKEQIRQMHKIIDQGLPVSQIERTTTQVKAHARAGKDPVYASWEEKLTKRFGAKTSIRAQARGGSIELQWQSEEDLKRLLDQLLV